MAKVPTKLAQKKEDAQSRNMRDSSPGRSSMDTLQGRDVEQRLAVAVHFQIMESVSRSTQAEPRPTFLGKALLWVNKHAANFQEPLQRADRLSLEFGSGAGNTNLKPTVEKASQYLQDLVNQVNAGYSLAPRSGKPVQLSELIQDGGDTATSVREWLSEALLVASQFRFHLLAG